MGDEPRVAFRLLHQHDGEPRRLQGLDEAIGPVLGERGVDALVSTNAVHLYTELAETFRAWWRVLRPGGKVFVQSGDIRNPGGPPGRVVDQRGGREGARGRQGDCLEDPRYEPYRAVLADPEPNGSIRRPLAGGLPARSARRRRTASALAEAGFEVGDTITRTVDVGVLEWYEATSVYPDLLAWVGGSPRVDGRQPTQRKSRTAWIC